MRKCYFVNGPLVAHDLHELPMRSDFRATVPSWLRSRVLALSQRGVEGIVLRIVGRVFRAGNIQIDDDGFLTAAHDHRLDRLVFAGIQLLMRNVGRNVDEISWAGFVDELQIVSPAKAGAAAHYVDYSFQFAVMMRAGLSIGMHHYSSRPELLRADPCMRDGLGARHSWSLRSVRVEFAAADDAQAVGFPVGLIVHRFCPSSRL
jgi:hypothetical protein